MGEVRWVRRNDDDERENFEGEWGGGGKRQKERSDPFALDGRGAARGCLLDVKSDTL